MTHKQLCLLMIATLEKLGSSDTAREDAQFWHDYYQKEFQSKEKELEKRRKPK